MNTTEFDEIRPYHDEELPRIFEELIADPAFQKAACTVIPNVPFEILAQKYVLAKQSWISRRPSAMISFGNCPKGIRMA